MRQKVILKKQKKPPQNPQSHLLPLKSDMIRKENPIKWKSKHFPFAYKIDLFSLNIPKNKISKKYIQLPDCALI